MPSIGDFSKIPTLLHIHFGEHLPSMRFLFSVRVGDEQYIFQEIKGLPIKGIVTSEVDYSIGWSSSWSSWECTDALLVDAEKNEIEVWRELLQRSRPDNMQPTQIGATSNGWRSQRSRPRDAQFKNGRKGKKNRKFDTLCEFKVRQVTGFYLWFYGFEVISDTICFMGFRPRLFPYRLDDHGRLLNTYEADEIQWTGRHFVWQEPEVGDHLETGAESPVNMAFGTASKIGPISWWTKDNVDMGDDFDEEMVQIFEGKSRRHEILDIGQRKTILDL
jgi:hypothetical protein